MGPQPVINGFFNALQSGSGFRFGEDGYGYPAPPSGFLTNPLVGKKISMVRAGAFKADPLDFDLCDLGVADGLHGIRQPDLV